MCIRWLINWSDSTKNARFYNKTYSGTWSFLSLRNSVLHFYMKISHSQHIQLTINTLCCLNYLNDSKENNIVWSLDICLIKSRRVKWGRCVARVEKTEIRTVLWWGNLNEREYLEDVGVDGNIKLKIKYTWRSWTLLMYSKMGTINRLWTR